MGALAAAEYAHATVVDASPLATALLRASLTAILLGVFAFGRKGIAELAAELEEPPPDRPAPRSSRRRLYRPQRRLRRPRG
ncbi:hypothetical protein [Amycolatopsis sp. AA4]|uniref:hypothetical protein n=1 Tax=Amycolatopsis sp. AA4 TaxID=1896961 RepID=UPI0002FAC8DC|nr:hypothetical protein [Amycolatopsis sp. AA4]